MLNATVTELSAALGARKISSHELTGLFLGRIAGLRVLSRGRHCGQHAHHSGD